MNTPELTATSNAAQTIAWLRSRRFQAFESSFASYSASDILSLARDDVIQICGLADGIRLYNALHGRTFRPKLSLYVTAYDTSQGLWHPIYLESLTSHLLLHKLKAALGLPNDRLYILTFLGPQGIHVLVTDDAVANIKDQSAFIVETFKGWNCFYIMYRKIDIIAANVIFLIVLERGTDRYKLLLKPTFNQ